MIVTSSRCPGTCSRATVYPLSSLWKVNRSMTPCRCSTDRWVVLGAVSSCGDAILLPNCLDDVAPSIAARGNRCQEAGQDISVAVHSDFTPDALKGIETCFKKRQV